MPDPQPCGLDHNGPHVATARPLNPLAALLRAAAVGAWGADERAAMAPGARAFHANLRDSMMDGDLDELIRTMAGQVKAWHA
jgi:hypothetical protein